MKRDEVKKRRPYPSSFPTASWTTRAASTSPFSIAITCAFSNVSTMSARRKGVAPPRPRAALVWAAAPPASVLGVTQASGNSRRLSRFESPEGARETPEGVSNRREPSPEPPRSLLFATGRASPNGFKILCPKGRPGSSPGGATRSEVADFGIGRVDRETQAAGTWVTREGRQAKSVCVPLGRLGRERRLRF